MFHKTTPELQDQDRSVQDQDHSLQDQYQDWFVWSQTGLVLRPIVSDYITAHSSSIVTTTSIILSSNKIQNSGTG